MANETQPHSRPLRWYQGLTKYHWWVLIIAVMSWMFDCMDQRIFVLSRAPALKELLGKNWAEEEKALQATLRGEVLPQVEEEIRSGKLEAERRDEEVQQRVDDGVQAAFASKAASFGDLVTALMVFGWSVGGFIFGIYGDKLGRVKTLSITISIYSVFTGLSGLSTGVTDFCIYRFLMGCGIGGAFATAATLIAETLPAHARAFALGLFQALSAVGNITGSAVARFVVSPDMPTLTWLVEGGVSGWRVIFMLGVLPAILVAFIIRTIKEPDAWHAARATAQSNLERQMGDIKSLFGTPRWRRNTFVGVSLAVIGVIGLWGVGFYSPELVDHALQGKPIEEVTKVKAMGTLLQDVGAFFGMLVFTIIATRMGRRLAFGGSFVVCWVVVSSIFIFLRADWHAYVMLPFLGFATLSLFGGYSIYFPELYPTRLRSTGTGFCYNVGRVLAAVVILFRIPIRGAFDSLGIEEPFRWVAVAMCTVYLLGLLVLIWAPETKGKPLPTDDDE